MRWGRGPGPWVSPPAAPGRAGLDEHRLGQRALPCDLLEHLPGDVPYSTHLAIENARARLVHRALSDALGGMRGGDAGESAVAKEDAPTRAACDRGAGPGARLAAVERPARSGHGEDVRAVPITEHAQRRTRWPLGGLVDLVV
ncbi:MAG TPA: hypothetical protein VFF69_10335 [Phycisphaerales bacterium]|nr:hypothetical protein [Phycisphaerales bacterium]